MQSLDRSARHACWFNAWMAGAAPLETAIDAVVGSDAAHHVVTDGAASRLGLGNDGSVTLLLAWGALRRAGATGATPALPTPGDPYGLAGPPEFTAAATDAGEAVVLHGCGLGLVPEEVGGGVFWRAYDAHEPHLTESVGDASRALRTALAETTRALLDLDLARWQPEVRAVLSEVRDAHDPLLAPGYAPRAEQLAATASRCLAITRLAATTDSAAVSAWEVDTRSGHLHGLARAARHGLVAACDDGRPR
ncbi:hypothetical protein CLV56_3044 [Mumia flava]|uniref:Uncharacterized protein n=1 Tax=Mumia flava TaxID=1348852 RepID=A0A0B2B4K6_9ACTN|nr:hypothetical protein [Mumia flava]PJJ53554.1 hypothetical protein CLV56_3044 [Mumia flava]